MRVVGAVATIAVAATACGGSRTATLQTSEEVMAALTGAMAASKVAVVSFDAGYDEAELTELMDLFDASQMASLPRADTMARAVAVLDGLSLRFANADDGSGQFAVEWEGAPLLDLRYDGSEAPSDPTMLEPYDFTLFTRFDADALRQLVGVASPDMVGMVDGIDLFEPSAILDEPLAGFVSALLDGDWASIDGTFDPAMFDDLSALGYSNPATTMDPPDAEELAALISDQFALGQPTVDGGETVVTFSVDAGGLMGAIYDNPALVADPEVAEAVDLLGLGDMDLYLEDVGSLRFRGDDLVEMRFDMLAAMFGPGLQSIPEGVDLDEVQAIVDGWSTTQLDLVVEFSDHGNVASLLGDVSDPASITWTDLQSALGGFFGEALEGSSVEGIPMQDIDVQLGSELRNLAVAFEIYFTDHGTYPVTLADLADYWTPTDPFVVTIADSSAQAYCVQARDPESAIQWRFDSDAAGNQLAPGVC